MSAYATISAVSRALHVLQLLAASPSGLSVSQASEQAAIEQSVASRILATLVTDGYARRDHVTGFYHLTYKLAGTALQFFETVGFPETCMPLLQELADRTGELVQLAVLEGHVMRFVAKAEGKHRLRVLSTLGRAAVLHVSTVGKAWLATLPTNEALKIVSAAGMPRFTSHTITTLGRFRAELEKVRRQGYAVNIEEFLEDASSVGAAVRLERPRPHVVGAISVLGPTSRMPRETLAKIGQDVVDVAAQLATLWPHMPV